MKIAIVNQHFHIGGVETFLLSLIRQFKRQGHDVYVFLLEAENANALLPGVLALDVVVAPFETLRSTAGSYPSFDIVLVTNTNTFCETLRQLTRGGFEADRLVVGAYQTRMYCLDRGPLNLHNRLVQHLFARVPVANAIFGNDACRSEHARIAPAMAQAPIVPLIVDGEKFPRRGVRDPNAPMRIVSIGRFDHFKTYNLTMPDVIRRLLDRGHAVRWDVYGSGILQAPMTQRIAELGLSEHIRLYGDIDYSSIPRVLDNAFAFVGSGLSMMEAAACGVPSLPAIEYNNLPRTFGFPHEIPGISFFEPGLSLPCYDLADKLETLIRATPAEYESIGDAGREKMSIFSPQTVAGRYMQTFETASTKRPALGAIPYFLFKISAALHHTGFTLLKWLAQLRS
jgi:glycosyltransferase involved in cell wall biosynthesis